MEITLNKTYQLYSCLLGHPQPVHDLKREEKPALNRNKQKGGGVALKGSKYTHENSLLIKDFAAQATATNQKNLCLY